MEQPLARKRKAARMPAPWAVVGMVVGLLTALHPAGASGAGAHPAAAPMFQPTPCDLPGITAAIGPRLRCGIVAVPRDREAPALGVFRLAVVILKAVAGAEATQADPVVYIAGGPGSPLTSRAALLAEHEAGVVAPDRDLILVDQRGAGRSEPALCPELARDQLAILAAGDEQSALVREWRNTYVACRHAMSAAGLRPEWFGTRITAADFDDVRQALGIARWNVYALSYGTAVAMTMMAERPAPLRAVVLDSVLPPDPLPLSLPESFSRSLTLLFAACRADGGCAATYPDLAETYREAVATLDATALPVPMAAGIGLTVFNLRAEAFRLIVDRALYARRTMALLPAFIRAARDRDAMTLQATIGNIVRKYLSMSLGDMAAVECRERTAWRAVAASDDVPVSAFVPGMCDGWSSPGPPPLIASQTRVPTLLLAGRVDPITPPIFARLAASRLGPAARVVVFANVGHGVQQSSACGERLVRSFMQAPANISHTTCANDIPPVAFR